MNAHTEEQRRQPPDNDGDTRVVPGDPVWYPFTQMREFLHVSPPVIVEAEGCWLVAADGRRYLDGVSSLWANLHGHRHPRIDAAVRAQLGRVAHSTMLGLTHPAGQELARRLVALAPAGLERVFYSDCGSAAVEVALKMAYQYRQLKGDVGRTTFLKLHNAYHGDTLGAVAVGGMDLFHERFGRLLFPTVELPCPDTYRHPLPAGATEEELCEHYVRQAEALLRRHAGEACALIVEPLLQGAAGMIAHPRGFLRAMRRLTRELGILLIADEVAVGCGRTGRMFACAWEEVEPDILCLGKGVSGGYLPLAATLVTRDIFNAFLGEHQEFKTFFHGHTYTGNPLACAAGIASLDVFEQERTLAPEVFGPKAERYARGMREISRLEAVGSARWRGLMGGVELVQDRRTGAPFPAAARMGHRVILEARKRGVMLRPLGDVIVLLPPLTVSLDEIDLMFEATAAAIAAVTG